MEYEYLEDIAIADAAFAARGKDLPSLFKAAADATMNVMVDPLDTIAKSTTRAISLEDDAVDMLLFQFLQEFIYFKDAQGLLLRAGEVQVDNTQDGYRLSAEAYGEPMDLLRHQMRVDVKAVTLHRFRVERSAHGWEATVVLDI